MTVEILLDTQHLVGSRRWGHMRFPIELVALVSVALTTSACKDEPGGIRGELNAGTFYYKCHLETDAQCDEDAVVAAADATTGAFPAIAAGSTFKLRFEEDGASDSSYFLSPGSSDFITSNDTVFTAERAGIVGLAATTTIDPVRALDLVHVRLLDVAGLRISQASTTEASVDEIAGGSDIEVDGSDVAIDVQNPVSLATRTFLRAVPVSAEGVILAGSLSVAWTSSDVAVIDIVSDPSDNVIEIESKGMGTATLTVTMGAATADITIDTGATP